MQIPLVRIVGTGAYEAGGKIDTSAAASGEVKPEYRVPTMSEIAAIEKNGFSVISTFAGAGGSSLGYRMAGFIVLWANEFVSAAREVYIANASRGTIVDGHDIRDVDPAEVLRSLKMKPGDLDVLDGSPPCASFSSAGKRAEHWGAVKKYSDKEQRTDDLFFEFIRFVKVMQPKVFVAENVSGLVKGVAKGYFLQILAAMKACGYRVEAKLLDAQWLGVPQARQRIIFVGVRDDLGVAPAHPEPLPYRYSVRDALPSLRNGAMIGANGGFGKETWQGLDDPAKTIGTSPKTGNGRVGAGDVVEDMERRMFSIDELKRICAFPSDFILTGSDAEKWERLGRAVPPVMAAAIAETIRDKILTPAAASSPGRPARRRSLRTSG